MSVVFEASLRKSFKTCCFRNIICKKSSLKSWTQKLYYKTWEILFNQNCSKNKTISYFNIIYYANLTHMLYLIYYTNITHMLYDVFKVCMNNLIFVKFFVFIISGLTINILIWEKKQSIKPSVKLSIWSIYLCTWRRRRQRRSYHRQWWRRAAAKCNS